jgi:hypothetical protein
MQVLQCSGLEIIDPTMYGDRISVRPSILNDGAVSDVLNLLLDGRRGLL